MKRVSVCLTHYNRPHKLAATLESLARQTRMPDEVFLWDDCSPEDPTSVVESFRGRFPHLVYRRNARNLGMPGNLNAVLTQATGDYVANLHDADVFHPQLLEKWAAALDAHPTAGMVFCGLSSPRPSGSGNRIFLEDIAPFTSGLEFFDRWFVGRSSSVVWGTVMVRKAVHNRLLPLKTKYRNWADVDLWMRICRDYDIAYVREPLICLDSTPTPQRRFSWYRVLLMQEMVIANIYELHANDSAALKCALARQRRRLRLTYVRLMLGSLRWLDLPRFGEGLRLGGRIFFADVMAGDGRLLEGVAAPS